MGGRSTVKDCCWSWQGIFSVLMGALSPGAELGQWNEWHYEYSLDWHLLQYAPHRQTQDFFKSMNAFYVLSATAQEPAKGAPTR